MAKAPYCNYMMCPDYEYKNVDGQGQEIKALYNRANAMNMKYNRDDMEKGRDAHVHRPNAMVESNKKIGG